MASGTATSSEARELTLISKVELRIALADTDEKLGSLLNTYLAPLLLKLGSDSLAVRNKVISVCQHINTRVQAPAIKLPVAALLKQFKEQKAQLIRHFDLIYLQQGIDRLGSEARVEILLPLLKDISEIGTTANQGDIVFNLVLRLLPLLNLPPKDSPEDVQLKSSLGLSDQDTAFLSSWFSKLLLLVPAEKDSPTCPGLSPADYAFLNKGAAVTDTWNPAADGGLNLTETKIRALRFISSGAFNDSERLIPAIISSADANSRLSDLGEELLKRFTPDLEDPDVVQQLYNLYFGADSPGGAPPARPALQTKLLVYLGKSIRATTDTEKVIRVIEDSLLSDGARSSQGLQASKLRTQVFNFTTWVARMGSPHDLKRIAPKIITSLKYFIESQGWPSPGASGKKLPFTDLSLRALAYEALGILVPKAEFGPEDGEEILSSFELIRWLFTSLSSDDSGPQIFVSIEQALGSILNSSIDSWDREFQGQIRPFLVHQMSNYLGEDDSVTGFKVVRGTQYAAVRFSNRFLPYSDVVARWIDLMALASGTEKSHEIVEEGKKGLHPYWYRLLNPRKDKIWAASGGTDSSWFDFPSFSETTQFLFGSTQFTVVPGMSASEFLSGTFKNAFAPAVTFLRNILVWESLLLSGVKLEIEQDWEAKLDVMLTSNEEARRAIKQFMQSSSKGPLILFLEAALAGLVSENREGRQQCGVHFVNTCSLASNSIVKAVVPKTLSLKNILLSNDQEAQNMTARAIGILASHPAFSDSDLIALVTELSTILESWESAIGEAVLKARGAILALAYLFSRLAFRKSPQRVPETRVKKFVQIVFDIIKSSRDSLLRRSAQVAIAQMSLSGTLAPDFLSDTEWETIRAKLVEDAKAENSAAIGAIGVLPLTFSKSDPNNLHFKELMNCLAGLHEIRRPEIHFAVGEALTRAAAGWNSKSLVPEFDVDEQFPESSIPDSVLADICDKTIRDCIASKPSLRRASAIWLLCLVKNCGHMQQIQQRLRNCQSAFTNLLGDRDEMVQETGAQGLSLVYEMGDQALKDDLVQDLVNSFTATGSNLRGGKVNEDTELFEPGALPTGGGSSVNTYKDIMNLASEAGDPTLVYRFMSLASNNAIWTSRAAFGKLGISSIFSDSSVNGYLAKNSKIYPKLFRYRFDPNPNVQRSMNTIWQALVKDPAAVVNAHFDEIMSDLLQSVMMGREWRVRQASCAAISDLIQGRQPEVYAKYMEEIFTKAFKLADDIKETVRVAALKLCQTITNCVIRTLETSDPGTQRVETMLGNTIPFLLSDKGIESSVQEIQVFALGALVEIIKKSPSQSLRPLVPRIIEQFLNSLSSLEPQAVNYVHLNADKYGLTGQEIDKMRLSSIRRSPMMEVTERYLIDMLDEASMKEFALKLEGVLRSAVGLPSKVGCSRLLVLLSMKTFLFQPYADRFIHLLGKYVVDRNDTVSASYCTSIGYLMRLASDDQVLKTIQHAKHLYLTAEETNQRAISAEILQSSSKLSNDRFMAFASTTLPFVFVAKHDLDNHVKEVFEKTWQENVGGNRAISLYIREIGDLVAQNLDSARWAIKHTAALGIADAITSLDPEIDLGTSEFLWPILEKALSGKTWDGKENVLKAFVKFASQAKQLWAKKPQLGSLIKTIAIREAKRNNIMYRPHGLTALGGVAQARKDLNFMPDAIKIVSKVLEELDDFGDPMDVDSGKGQGSRQTLDNTLAACVECLLQCINSTQHASIEELRPIIHDVAKRGGRGIQVTLYEELRQLFNSVTSSVPQEDGQANNLREMARTLAGLTEEMLSLEIDVSVEAIRKGRAQAAASWITLCRKSGLPVGEGLQQQIKDWRTGERSGPVQQVLDQMIGQLASK